MFSLFSTPCIDKIEKVCYLCGKYKIAKYRKLLTDAIKKKISEGYNKNDVQLR